MVTPSPITVLSIAVLVVALVGYLDKGLHKFALAVSFLNALSECLSYAAVVYKSDTILVLIYNCYYVIHSFLWTWLLLKLTLDKRAAIVGSLFCLFGEVFLYFFYVETAMNSAIVLFANFVFVILYGILLVTKMKNEDLEFFQSPTFLLVSAPLLFSIANICNFGFLETSDELQEMEIFNLGLYEWLSWTGNIFYYGFMLSFFLFAGRFRKQIRT